MGKASWKVNLYNKKHAFVYEYGQDLVNLLDPKPDELILDLGCGSGQLTNEISKSGAHVIGMDSSAEMIKEARSKYSELEFQVENAASFQFSKPFDAIFSNAVLHWVKSSENAIKCMYNNLKGGGRIVLEFGGKGNVKTIIDSTKKNLKKRGFLNNAKLENWYFPSISEYSILLEKQGFEVELAQLYDRPTELSDDKRGIMDWVEMFGAAYFKDVPKKIQKEILADIQNDVSDQCQRDGKWYADYRRIRIVAKKVSQSGN